VRILVVTHRFPPRSFAGTEVYALEAARRVAARGHDVHVLSAWKEVSLRHGARLERTFDGLPIVEFVDNLFDENFRATWDRPKLDSRLGAELDRIRPDLVHVHHLMYLSTGLLDEARRRGIPVVFTLHDAWLGCARFGQLRHADDTLCDRVDPARCATCLPSYPWRQSDSAIRVGNALATIRALTDWNLFALARWLRPRPRTRTPSGRLPIPPVPVQEAYAEHVRVRNDVLRARAERCVQRFLSPSAWLARTMIEWGLPPDRVFTLATGVDGERFAAASRVPRADRVRVRFLGTLVPHKGAHVLLEAWDRLPADIRARGELVLYGPDHHDPGYVKGLRAMAARTGALLEPALDRDGVVRELARTDVLVVPSQWYENRPLVILEALAAGVPVLCTDLGGMRELVQEGVQGQRFPFNDAQRLRDLLAQLLAEPARLDALRPRADESLLPTWDKFTDELVQHYGDTLRAAGSTAAP
jgi:glycosyltransferase involved in cell wall biosynthesis